VRDATLLAVKLAANMYTEPPSRVVAVLKAVASACVLPAVFIGTLTLNAAPNTEDAERDFFRVELPLPQSSYQNANLSLQDLITEETFIDVSQFHLHAVEVVASTQAQGAVRLQVGRFITPAVSPPPGSPGNTAENAGEALYIAAPHRSKKDWQLVIENQVAVHHLTAILEPQASALAVLNTHRPANTDPNGGFGEFSQYDDFQRSPFDRRGRFDNRSPFFRNRLDPFNNDFRGSRFRRRDSRTDPWRSRGVDNVARAVRFQRAQERARQRALAQQLARERALERARRIEQDPNIAGGRSSQPDGTNTHHR